MTAIAIPTEFQSPTSTADNKGSLTGEFNVRSIMPVVGKILLKSAVSLLASSTLPLIGPALVMVGWAAWDGHKAKSWKKFGQSLATGAAGFLIGSLTADFLGVTPDAHGGDYTIPEATHTTLSKIDQGALPPEIQPFLDSAIEHDSAIGLREVALSLISDNPDSVTNARELGAQLLQEAAKSGDNWANANLAYLEYHDLYGIEADKSDALARAMEHGSWVGGEEVVTEAENVAMHTSDADEITTPDQNDSTNTGLSTDSIPTDVNGFIDYILEKHPNLNEQAQNLLEGAQAGRVGDIRDAMLGIINGQYGLEGVASDDSAEQIKASAVAALEKAAEADIKAAADVEVLAYFNGEEYNKDIIMEYQYYADTLFPNESLEASAGTADTGNRSTAVIESGDKTETTPIEPPQAEAASVDGNKDTDTQPPPALEITKTTQLSPEQIQAIGRTLDSDCPNPQIISGLTVCTPHIQL